MSENDRVKIIAEIGINHNGNINTALEMIDAAKDSGADYVKFQIFLAENIVTRRAPKAEYQNKATDPLESQFDMIKKLEISNDGFTRIKEYCDKKNIGFLASCDETSLDFYIKLKPDFLKIPSGEITNLPYLRKIGKLNKRVILSTGMANINEIDDALKILTGAGTSLINITVLHANSEYPTPYQDVNLHAMKTIADYFKVKVGYSDHTLGIEIPIAAVALGASVIEKHFTLDRNMDGPDHKASLEPEELKAMVKAIRNIEKAMGNGVKKPSLSETKNIDIARKSIVAARNIKKGEILTEENIAVKRPGIGISPMKLEEVIGKEAIKYFKEDDLIEL